MNHYGTISAADTYHSERGNTQWTGSNELKTAALIRASSYIDGRYRWKMPSGRFLPMFSGVKTGGIGQILEWPRTGAVDYEGNAFSDTEIPRVVEWATYEAAIRELVAPGSLSPDFVATATRKRTKVGPIEVEYALASAVNPNWPNRPFVGAIDEIIAPVLIVPSSCMAIYVV